MPKASALDEYLEKIYILESEGVTVIGARVAEFMSVRAPTVTEALHRLVQRGLITMDEHHVISLTAEGRLKAEDTVRRHRVAERWLTDVIGLDWAQADEGAHKLAHAFSAEIVERLSEIMGEPTTCPHGNPIPGNWPPPVYVGVRLEDAPPGQEFVVERVVEHAEVDSKLLRHLWSQGLVPGAHVGVVDTVPGAGTITILLNGHEVTLGMSAASKIQVRPLQAAVSVSA